MSPEAQRIAIAGACPTLFEYIAGKRASWHLHSMVWRASGVEVDPLSDLNAMHEAEKVLSGEQWENYRQELWAICGHDDIRAIARQRAEALLRTLGQWEDGK